MSGSKNQSKLYRQPFSITSSHNSESLSSTNINKPANGRQSRQFSSFTSSTAFVPTKPTTRIDKNLSMDSLDFIDVAPQSTSEDPIRKNSFHMLPGEQEATNYGVEPHDYGYKEQLQRQKQRIFSTRPSTTCRNSTSIGAIGCNSLSYSLSSTNSNAEDKESHRASASTSFVKSNDFQKMHVDSIDRHGERDSKNRLHQTANSSKKLLSSCGIDPSDIEDIEIVDMKNVSFSRQNFNDDQVRKSTISFTPPLSVLNDEGDSNLPMTTTNVVEPTFARPISAGIKTRRSPRTIRKQASIKSSRFSKRFQTRWSVENQSDGSIVNDGKSGEHRPVTASSRAGVTKFPLKVDLVEAENGSSRLESAQVADGLDAPCQSVILNKNRNDIVVIKDEPIVASKQSSRHLAFSEDRHIRSPPAEKLQLNLGDDQASSSGNNLPNRIPVSDESLKFATSSTGIERIGTPQTERNATKNHSLENGVLALYDPNGAPQLPSKISLIARFCSKFCRRNRIDMVRQDLVAIDLPETTAVANVESVNTSKMQSYWRKIIFDTSENYFYYWLAIISTAYVYNLLVVVARTVFIEMSDGYLWVLWLSLDLFADSIYFVDMFIRSRTGFLEQGLLIRDGKKIFTLYLRSKEFKIDLASIFPLDHVIFAISRQKVPFLRFNRLLRRERIQKFMEQTETRSSLPNAFRVGVVVWYIAIIIHWNACFYFFISERIGLGTDGWVYGWKNEQSLPKGIADTLTRRYIYSFYWSTLILTTIGEVPAPQMNIEYAFVTIDLMCGVLIFATIVGNVGSMISNMSAARTEFQNRIDNIKQYMELRKVGKQLEVRVIKWFDYLWANKQNLADQQVLKVLPDKLQAEIAMHVHFETLRKVRIFQDCEAGLLAELVLKLQLQVFSPMDYVCRKGDIGREMYIVKRGMIQVVSDDGNKVFATLSEGAVFGELSILNIAGSKNGNRRTANVRSVGYTDLFVLNKTDLWVALREYPEARKILIQKGRELLRKDNLLDESAPEENKTAEEIGDELQSSVRILQTRIARLTAEHTNTETKLRDRIRYLERKLGKYGVILKRACSATDDDDDDSYED